MRKLKKLLTLLPNQVFRKALKHGVAASTEHAPLLHGLDLRTIVDVGANRGQYSLFCRSLFPEAKIIAFEPIAGPAEKFSAVLPEVPLHRYAISDTDGSTTINLHQLDVGASFLPLGEDQIGTQTIETRRLDTFLKANDITADALLKIDVQGCEDRVINGASGILHRFRYIVCEVAFFPMLEGQPLVHQIIDLMRAHGFTVRGINEVKMLNGTPAWCDIMFER
jgi:FkbM family methyltransferase